MQILIFLIKLISIPLIIIVGESLIDEKRQTIILLVLAFLYNNLLGFVTLFAILLFSVSPSILSIIIIGFLLLVYLITINIYVIRKININIMLYIILNVAAFLTGIFLK